MSRKWLQVEANKSVSLLEVKASLHRLSRLVISFPPHTARVKSLLLKPSSPPKQKP